MADFEQLDDLRLDRMDDEGLAAYVVEAFSAGYYEAGRRAEAVEFVLWHEFLHLHLKQLHTKEFRRMERLRPDNARWDAELETLNERFGLGRSPELTHPCS